MFLISRFYPQKGRTKEHLLQCIAYIDMSMVRTGVVKHPSKWPLSGYREIQGPPKIGGLIDRRSLLELCCEKDERVLINVLAELSEQALLPDKKARDAKWSESIAVGSLPFAKETKEKLGVKAKGGGVYTSGASSSLSL